MEPSFTPQNADSGNWRPLAIPLAIIAGFALVSIAIFFSDLGSNQPVLSPTPAVNPSPQATGKIRPVDKTDYIKGNPNAPIMIVEYSDYECAFCKQFHETMNRIMDEYGVNGKVAWVYRQFPVTELHPNADRIAQSALCVGSLAGNDAFWKFSDKVFGSRAVNELTNLSLLPVYAEELGVTKQALNSCLESDTQRSVMMANLQDGINAGIDGTPQSYVLVGNQMETISGAQPYAVIKQIIESLLSQLEGRLPAATSTPAE